MFKVERYESTEKLFKTLDTREANGAWSGHELRSRDGGRKRFTGTENWEQALGLARNGYHEPVDNMKKLTASKTLATAERIGLKPSKPVNSFIGGSPNVTRAMMGVPRDMRRTMFEKRKVPGIELVYDMSIPAAVSAAEMERHGTRFLALANVLMMSNIPVKLTASIAIDDVASCTVRFDVMLKDYNKVVNIEKLAFYLAHPSFLRRIGFALIETSPLVTRYHGGYGLAITSNGAVCSEMRTDARKNNARWFTFDDFDSDGMVEFYYKRIKEGR